MKVEKFFFFCGRPEPMPIVLIARTGRLLSNWGAQLRDS